MNRRRATRGTSLVELLIVVSLLGLLAQSAVPGFRLAFETRRVDEAESMLQCLWKAERMHWLEHGHFTKDMQDLVAQRLLDRAALVRTGPFRYVVLQADSHGFAAEAVRIGSAQWNGSLTINETGVIDGAIAGQGGAHVAPSNP